MLRADYWVARAESGRSVKKVLLMLRREMTMAHRGPQMEAVEREVVGFWTHFEGRSQCQEDSLIAGKNNSANYFSPCIGPTKHHLPHCIRHGVVV